MKLFKPNIEKMSRRRDVAGLLTALESEDREIWMSAARALAAIGDERALAPLGRKLEYCGPRSGFRSDPGMCALGALVTFGNEAAAQTLVSLFSPAWRVDAREPAEDALAALGERAVRPLCEELQPGRNPGFGSQRAMRVIKRIASPAALPAVTDFVRAYIAGRAAVIPSMWVGAAGVDDSTCITYAIEYLTDQGGPEVAGTLADLLGHLTERARAFLPDSEGRAGISNMTTACITGLRDVGSVAAVPALEAVVGSADANQTEQDLAAGVVDVLTAASPTTA